MFRLLPGDVVPLNGGYHPGNLLRDLFRAPLELTWNACQLHQAGIDGQQGSLNVLFHVRQIALQVRHFGRQLSPGSGNRPLAVPGMAPQFSGLLGYGLREGGEFLRQQPKVTARTAQLRNFDIGQDAQGLQMNGHRFLMFAYVDQLVQQPFFVFKSSEDCGCRLQPSFEKSPTAAQSDCTCSRTVPALSVSTRLAIDPACRMIVSAPAASPLNREAIAPISLSL